MTSRQITTLQFASTTNYHQNLEKLVHLIRAHASSDILIAPEVCLTNFDYEHVEDAADFYEQAIHTLRPLIGDQIFCLTLIKATPQGIVNRAIVMHQHQIIYSQDKAKLFALGDEHHYFVAGQTQHISKFQIGNLTYGILICFELRFKELWQRLEGCDIILIPAQWGKPRKSHIETLSRALAIINQCFVVVSNGANDDMAKSSAIITPNGDVTINDRLEAITHTINLRELKKIRRYITVH